MSMGFVLAGTSGLASMVENLCPNVSGSGLAFRGLAIPTPCGFCPTQPPVDLSRAWRQNVLQAPVDLSALISRQCNDLILAWITFPESLFYIYIYIHVLFYMFVFESS